MTESEGRVAYFRVGEHQYPASHWREIKRFVEGDESDPKGCFRLSDDVWEAWQYGERGRPSHPGEHRFHFKGLRSFLKPYVKWHCYARLLASGGRLRGSSADLPYSLRRADDYAVRHGFKSLDDIASAEVFAPLWEAHLRPYDQAGPRPYSSVSIQTQTRTFWEHLRRRFGAPQTVPPIAPHARRTPNEFAADESMLIPPPVTRQLVNKLALHRAGKSELNRFHHLRLCVLMLVLCLGRRIGEILSAPRGEGGDGPLHRYPYRGGSPEGALWFRFRPNKDGPGEYAYVSPEWEDVVYYSVGELIRYGDEVREFAPPEERDLLILVSAWNWTKHSPSSTSMAPPSARNFSRTPSRRKRVVPAKTASGLSYGVFNHWLNVNTSRVNRENQHPGVMGLWNITADGSADGPVYRLRTKQARHGRQNALAGDPRIPLKTRQWDLNHTDINMQATYQHHLAEQNRVLLERMTAGGLLGKGVQWLYAVTGVEPPPGSRPRPGGTRESLASCLPACIVNNPQFVQASRVRCGWCVLPQGPAGCEEYMNCTEAQEGGCAWFVTDPGNEEVLQELDEKARAQRRAQEESAAAGRAVQAEKREAMASRTEALRDEAVRLAPREMVERLRERYRQIEGGAA
ncbi:MAG: hypothetical protein M3416_02755 [Acidobacteriota bacterium]|nr:hypothetical protein [Acidobacteriota bacterium]